MFAYVLIPHLPVQVTRQCRSSAASMFIVDMHQGRVIDATPDVLERGVGPGTSLHQARQRAPMAQEIESLDAVYKVVQDGAFYVLGTFANRIETVALGEFLLDWEGSAAHVEAMLRAVRIGSGLHVQIGVAEHRFTAEQAARHAPESNILIIPSGEDAEFLSRLPVTALPAMSDDLCDRLRDFGIRTLGEMVTALRRTAFVRQFGSAYVPQYDMARGADPRPLLPDAPPLRFALERRFDEPVEQTREIIAATGLLGTKLAELTRQRGYQAEVIELVVTFAKGQTREMRHECKPPTADEQQMVRAVTHLVETLAPDKPVFRVAVIAYPVRPEYLGNQQLSMFRSEMEVKREQLAESSRRIRRRYGERILAPASTLAPPPSVPVHVESGQDGKPRAIGSDRDKHDIVSIEERWREESGWSDKRVCRDFYRVVLEDGSHRNLFIESGSGAWNVDRSCRLL